LKSARFGWEKKGKGPRNLKRKGRSGRWVCAALSNQTGNERSQSPKAARHTGRKRQFLKKGEAGEKKKPSVRESSPNSNPWEMSSALDKRKKVFQSR